MHNMSKSKIKYFLLILVIIAIGVYLMDFSNSEESVNYVSVTDAMIAESDTLFEKALESREFSFPDDHAAHNNFKLEWWYFTGNIATTDGKKYGYQFTIFRNALNSQLSDVGSSFATNQMYFAHLGLTDIGKNKHYHFEKFARGINGIAGAEANPLSIYIENWEIKADYPNGNYKMPNFRIIAKDSNISIDLELIPHKEMVLHGDRGLSPKSSIPGNASYYYSYTRLGTNGKISIDKQESQVSGYSWMDREWSTSALSSGQTGWDWFSIQFDDNSELMYFRLRDSLGNTDFGKGTYVYPDGRYEKLSVDDVDLKILKTKKLNSGSAYPLKWSFDIPKYLLKMDSQVQVDEQEMKLSVKYYEGSIIIKGEKNGKPIKGLGYVELTGY